MTEAIVVAGVDEAGRGCLAGPVYAAAVILPDKPRLRGLNDSKQLTPERREELFPRIQERALAWSVGVATVEEIDRINILHAALLAMRRAVEALAVQPSLVQVDGNQPPPLACRVETIVEGDSKIRSIMAASILAKVARDREMVRLDEQYPGYGFARHKGYGTPEHLDALHKLGPCVLHRRYFAPVAQLGFQWTLAAGQPDAVAGT